MEYKSAPEYVKTIEGRTVEGIVAVTGNVDDGGDRIWKGAFKKTITENNGRVRHLWQHDYTQPPIATVKHLEEVPARDLPGDVRDNHPTATGGLLVVREYLNTPRAEEVFQGIQSGAIKEMSFGFDPVKYDFEEGAKDEAPPFGIVRNLRELRLWDTSDVNWGMNPATVASKAAIPYHDYGTADSGTSWSKPSLGDFTDQNWGDLSASERRRIANHFAWSANMPPETFGDLKLPHHTAKTSGVGPAVWNGVRAAMSVLMGGMGGVNVPSGDRQAIYTHLSRHYSEFSKEPPPFKSVEASHTIAQYLDMEDLTEEKLMQALAVLKDVLTAEPQPIPTPEDASQEEVNAALTVSLLQRLAIMERDPILLA